MQAAVLSPVTAPVPRATLIILPLEQCPTAPLSLPLSLSLYLIGSHRHCSQTETAIAPRYPLVQLHSKAFIKKKPRPKAELEARHKARQGKARRIRACRCLVWHCLDCVAVCLPDRLSNCLSLFLSVSLSISLSVLEYE